MKAISSGSYCCAVYQVMLFKVGLILESENEILKRDHERKASLITTVSCADSL